ncbi:MAG: DUF4861 domain-containing protein [Candidatus Omnitrophota bacterium]|jgi:hypothetical protein|nr:MAG: DUF4861 domain-containing protein [Candidatus Omnitrophota bacterium]
MNSWLRYFILFFVLSGIISSLFCVEGEKSSKQCLFEKVFGSAVILDPAMHEKTLTGKPGERHYFDTDGDGRPDEVWFVDTASRHPEKYRPVLVRAIDEDGDLREGFEPDLDSDLYVADWNGDGSVDAVLDYTDVDGDDDVDEMGMFFFGGTHGYFGEDVLRVWWGRDVGDDNLLWFDIAYTYDQTLCQYRTHFGGDELFAAFAIPENGEEWTPFFENPFLFYDHDGDGITEEVLRISGVGDNVECIRHSFDADDDATIDSPRDFDFSITAWASGAFWTPQGKGRGRSNLQFGEDVVERTVIRGIPTGPFVRFEAARQFVQPIVWERTMLTWDENDINVDGQNFADADERWEGVIAHGIEEFPQVGGPSCGSYNKRYELILKPKEPTRLYYHPTDHRIHLRGADCAWMDVDYDYDRFVDMRYKMRDADLDGVLDTWILDVNADGLMDDIWHCRSPQIVDVGIHWPEIHRRVSATLKETPIATLQLNQRLLQALRGIEPQACDEAALPIETLDKELILKMYASDEGALFFLTLFKDRLIYHLKQIYDKKDFWEAFNPARADGDLNRMRRLVEQEFDLQQPLEPFKQWLSESFLAQMKKPCTAWAEDWVPPNIGWESEKIAYRVYWGQFDFFGKNQDCLLYPTIEDKSYHDETEWGIDALLVGETVGCGGVTLYVNSQAYPVMNPAGKGDIEFTKKMISHDEECVTIELLAQKVGPSDAPYTVRFHCSALAGRADSPIEILVTGGRPDDSIELGVGLIKLPQEKLQVDANAGVMGAWGFQTPVIGVIGMGIVFPSSRFLRFVDLPQENQVVLAIEHEKPLVYHVQCDWLRGRRFNCCPTIVNWMKKLRATAKKVRL